MMTVQQAAEKWGVSVRYVQAMCKNGKIPDVQKFGLNWMLPDEAQKPLDGRMKSARQQGPTSPRITLPIKTPFPLMSRLYSTPGGLDQCRVALSGQPELADLLEAWVLHAQGEAEKAVQLAQPLMDVPMDFYAAISVGHILCACAMWLNDTKLFSAARKHILCARCTSNKEEQMRELWLQATEMVPNGDETFLKWFENGSFDLLPQDSMPAAWFHYVKHLSWIAKAVARKEVDLPGVQGMGMYRSFLYIAEPLVVQVRRDGSVLAEMCMSLLCADAWYCLEDLGNTIRHLDRAIDLALADRLFGTLAEFKGIFSELLHERLMLKDASAANEVDKLYKKMMRSWTELPGNTVSSRLSDRENQVAQFAALGMSNAEIAQKLNISVHSVKALITSVMNKLGIHTRREIPPYIL